MTLTIRQLLHALELREALSASEVEVEECWFLESAPVFKLPSGATLVTTTMRSPDISEYRNQNHATLSGKFFLGELYPSLIAPLPSSSTALTDLKAALRIPLSAPPDGRESLTIHIRSGDVFSDSPPHTAYGQPPLAFYTFILGLRKWRTVTLVYEDNKNPVIDAVALHCQQNGISFNACSSSLAADLGRLLCAENIVASSGSFCNAIVALSDICRNVYSFENTFTLYPSVSPRVSNIRIIDAQGDYKSRILSNNWEASQPQLDMMLSYSETSLRIVP